MKAERSLKMRAVDFLSRREHSRMELGRKLARYSEDADDIASVLDEMARQGLLSDERFAQSLVHRRAPGRGTSRVLQELRQHGVGSDDIAAVRDDLAKTEVTRARAVWAKRFGGPPADATERAKQMRFLAARGFGHDAIRRVVSGADEDLD